MTGMGPESITERQGGFYLFGPDMKPSEQKEEERGR